MLTKAQQPSPIMTAMASATTVSGKYHGVGRVAIGAQIAGVGNENLIDDVVQRAHQQRDDAGNGVLPHELADTLRPQKLISGIHKNSPFFRNKKMRKSAKSGLTHFCRTISL